MPNPPHDPRSQHMLRVPASLLASIRATADQEGISVNNLVCAILAGAVGYHPSRQDKLTVLDGPTHRRLLAQAKKDDTTPGEVIKRLLAK